MTSSRVNSKATLRVYIKDLLHRIPKILHPKIEASRYYAGNSKSLVIAADNNRDRSDNIQECYKRLHGLIMDAGKNTIKGKTSQAQSEKVKNL